MSFGTVNRGKGGGGGGRGRERGRESEGERERERGGEGERGKRQRNRQRELKEGLARREGRKVGEAVWKLSGCGGRENRGTEKEDSGRRRAVGERRR